MLKKQAVHTDTMLEHAYKLQQSLQLSREKHGMDQGYISLLVSLKFRRSMTALMPVGFVVAMKTSSPVL